MTCSLVLFVHLEPSFADQLYHVNSFMLREIMRYHPVFKGLTLVNWTDTKQPIQSLMAIPSPAFSPVSESSLSVCRELSLLNYIHPAFTDFSQWENLNSSLGKAG
jgi:hypothetical protein